MLSTFSPPKGAGTHTHIVILCLPLPLSLSISLTSWKYLLHICVPPKDPYSMLKHSLHLENCEALNRHKVRHYTRLTACVRAESLQACLTLRTYGLQPGRLLCPWDSPGKNTGVGYRALLQGIFQPRGRTHMSCIPYIGRWVLYH